MHEPTDDPLRPTLPIPDALLRKRKARVVARSPVTVRTGGAAVAIAGTAAILSLPVVSAGVAVAATGGLLVYWKRRMAGLEPKILKDLVDESNQAQNKALLGIMKELEKAGYKSYATSLGNFVSVKSEIEKELSDHGTIDDAYQRTENLIDTLVADVADQFQTLVKLDRHQKALERSSADTAKTRREEIRASQASLAKQIERAYLALREIGRNVSDIIDPIPATRDLVTSRLEQTISELHTESEIAQGIGSRLEEGES